MLRSAEVIPLSVSRDRTPGGDPRRAGELSGTPACPHDKGKPTLLGSNTAGGPRGSFSLSLVPVPTLQQYRKTMGVRTIGVSMPGEGRVVLCATTKNCLCGRLASLPLVVGSVV